MNRLCPTRTARKGSVYVAVTGTAILVSLIGLTALHVSRLELKIATTEIERAYARSLAQSGVEFAVSNIESNLLWRSTHTHGVEKAASPTDLDEIIRYRLLDNVDNNLSNDTTQPIEIEGIGRWGSSEYRYNVTYEPSVSSEQTIGPTQLRNFEPGSSNWSSTSINNSFWVGQYFLPNLPVDATSWNVTTIEVQMAKNGAANSTLDVSLYYPDGSLLPGTLLETKAVPESSLPTSAGTFHTFTFNNATGLDPAVGLCLTLTTTSSPASDLDYESGGVSESNTALLTNGGSGWISESNKSLYYRVNGSYVTSATTGDFTITPGSWQRVVVP